MALQKPDQRHQYRGFAGPGPKVSRVEAGQRQQPVGKPLLTNRPRQRPQRQYVRFYCGLLVPDHQSGVDMKPMWCEPRMFAVTNKIGVAPVSKTILVVEDNDLNMKLFCDLLAAHGYATLQASDGRGVVELVRRERPDLILMDMQLPDVSGLDVTRELKADPDLATIPVIAITAFAMKGDEERIRAGGCEAYIAKPISVQRFIEMVKIFVPLP
jgi:two-component system, cell cycle response regulator DivK